MSDDKDRLWVASMPDSYQRWLAPTVFAPFAADLARRASRFGSRRVLELAAGTGVLTSELVAVLSDAEVTATDLNLPMVDYGSACVPQATWKQANALDLPFEDQQFDLVVCQFGVMFFPDKPTAFAEARRVLAPGGCLLFNAWGPVETHKFAAALVAGLERAFPEDPPTFLTDVPHGYADPDRIVSDLAAGGFDLVSIDTVTLEGNAQAAADVVLGFCTGTPLRMAIEARGDLEATIDVIQEEMTSRLGPGPVTAPMTAHILTARQGR